MATIFNEDNTIEQMMLSTLQKNGWKYSRITKEYLQAETALPARQPLSGQLRQERWQQPILMNI